MLRPGHPRALELAELRSLRQEAQRAEADLSYVRRLLQGRIDILGAELTRRASPCGREWAPAEAGFSGRTSAGEGTSTSVGVGMGTGAADRLLSARLSLILADKGAPQRSSARHVRVGAPQGEEYRRLAHETLDEVGLSDLGARTDEELRAARGRLLRCEQEVSGRRQELQRTADECGAEITRRYREGEAQVDDLLA
ncbi:hypothetical protein [Streptomyces sp. NA04227]|uniref:RsiG family protein n=1 Tax=Streptomyces sp. NA04227 TaxID=2742136 RepID=UPI0020CA6D6C|nr:hypothetical protein [Streptomyces sp. NA04227]